MQPHFYVKKHNEEIDPPSYIRTGTYHPGANCVQEKDDSRVSAIRIPYRTLLRSSSSQDPRYPFVESYI
jgi:hypothetical protein